MNKAVIQLETLTCPSCLQKIDAAVTGLDGINKEETKVMFNSSKVKTEFDGDKVSINDIEKVIEDLGYPVVKSSVKAA